MPPIRRTTKGKLQKEIFNPHYLEKFRRGELREIIIEDPFSYHPARPYGSRRIKSHLYDGNQHVAIVIYFKSPDGAILHSGKPDPVWVWLDGVIYKQ